MGKISNTVQSGREKSLNKVRYSFLKILTGSDLSRRRLPQMRLSSPTPGPGIWLTACMHGDEVGGIVIVQEIFRRARLRLLKGTINAFPLMNPLGFETISRNITIGREDLNRSFPGNSQGSLGERLAQIIFSTIIKNKPDLVIDLHNDWIKSLPYVLLDSNQSADYPQAYLQAQQFARQSGFCLIEDTEMIHSSLTHNLLRHNIPALTYEMGEPYVVNEHYIDLAVKSIWNILMGLEMVTSDSTPFEYPLPPGYNQGRILKYSDKPYSSGSGILRFLVKPGDVVKTGQPLARIVNAFGKPQQTIQALKAAIVLGHADSSVVFPGMPVMTFGIIEA